MPGLNHTGPRGEGPRTGRGKGLCGRRNADDAQSRLDEMPSAGMRRRLGKGHCGMGRGKGRCDRSSETPQ